MLTRFSLDLDYWPSLISSDPVWNLTQKTPRQNSLSKIHEVYLNKCDLQSVNKVVLWFGQVT